MPRWLLCALVALGLVLGEALRPPAANAQTAQAAPTRGHGPRIEVPPLLLFPLGLHIGTIAGGDVLNERNFTVGGELSIVYYDWLRWSWVGGFVSADALFQSSGAKVAFGPELGFWPFGVDAGPVWMNVDNAHGWGMQGRFHLTGLVSSLYVGVAVLGPRATTSGTWEPLFEFGLLLKFPAFLWRRLPSLPRFRDRRGLLYDVD